MSLPRVDQSLGTLRTPKRTWRVLNCPLPAHIYRRYDALPPEHKQPPSSIPWQYHRCRWVLRNDRLYLTELFRPGLLEMLTAETEMPAVWVEELILHRATEMPLDSEECIDTNTYRLHITRYMFEKGKFIGERSSITTRSVIKGVFGCEDW
jgi:hypothetical protein